MSYEERCYALRNPGDIISPSLIYYKDQIMANTKHAIDMAGGADRLIPHVKTHKMAAVVRLQMEQGVRRFKCATVAEAEMVAGCGPEEVVLSYPLVGPNILRFLRLQAAYPSVRFHAIGDAYEQIALLSEAATAEKSPVSLLLDVNMGMNRTGAGLPGLEELYRRCAELPCLTMAGFHCYDGHNGAAAPSDRRELTREAVNDLLSLRERLRNDGTGCDIMVMGGTPSFQVYRSMKDVWLSPGTLFIQDHGYASKYPDLDFVPGAAILSRIVSHPAPGAFTLDCGTKAIAADPPSPRGVIAGMPNTEPLFQSEEHWVFRMTDGAQPPPIGTVVYVIPTHICPTSALYPSALVASDGAITENWEVTARNRRITI